MDSTGNQEETPEQGRQSKRPRTQAPFQRIPSYLLPTIASYIPIPHLQFRLVNKEWDNAVKFVHSMGQCQQCEARCRTTNQVRSRMARLTRRVNDQEETIPWMFHWKISELTPKDLVFLEHELIPHLDSLQSPHCFCFTLGRLYHDVFDPERKNERRSAEWGLLHSKPPKYIFFFSSGPSKRFPDETTFLSFVCAPAMKHVTDLSLDPSRSGRERVDYPYTSFLNSSTFSSLKSLCIDDAYFAPQDADCLAHSPHLTNLTRLSFSIRKSNTITTADHTAGLTAVICSPIMKNVKSFGFSNTFCLSHDFLDAFAHSKYLKNLTHLSFDGIITRTGWSLEPLLRCSHATMPALTSLSLQSRRLMSTANMTAITSPTSSLMNRIECLDLSNTCLSYEVSEILFSSRGLQSLKYLKLRHSNFSVLLLASSSPSQFPNLQHLDLCSNSYIDDSSIRRFFSSGNLPSLQTVLVGNQYPITAYVLEKSCKLPTRPNLRRLSFGHELSDEEKQHLSELKAVAPQLATDLGRPLITY